MNLKDKLGSFFLFVFFLLFVKDFFLILKIFIYEIFIRLWNVSSDQELVKNEVSLKLWCKFYFMEVKYKIEFTDVSKIFVKHLNKSMNKLQDNELVFILINNGNEIKWGVSFVDNFVVFVLNKVAHFRFTSKNELIDLRLNKKDKLLWGTFVFLVGRGYGCTIWSNGNVRVCW